MITLLILQFSLDLKKYPNGAVAWERRSCLTTLISSTRSRNGCAYPLPSRITIVASYIQSAISVLILVLKLWCSSCTYTGNSNITISRHDFKFSLVVFYRNYSAYQ